MQIGLILPTGSHVGDPSPFEDVRRFALRAEALGFDSLWAFDHVLLRLPGEPERAPLEAWTTMSVIGGATSRIGIGSLVLAARLRNPALLAKMAVTLDQATDGRVTLGVGAGWHDPEFQAFGYPLDHRLGRTDEAFGILRGLLDGERVTAAGRWERADDAIILPPPRRRIPLLSSSRAGRMARIVARHADIWNGAWVGSPEDAVLLERREALMRACDEVGRDPSEIELTAGISVRYDDATEPSPTRGRGDVSGEPAQVADGLAAFDAAGYSQVMVWLGPMDVEGLERLAEAVAILRE